MDRFNTMIKYFKYFSYLAILSSWITILISVYFNPWFKLTRNALSDLGGGNLLSGHPPPKYPFIYNYGMIITGLFMILFSIYIIYVSRNKIENSGGTIFSISGLFLILIGIYHEGTYPHDFVSMWFYIITSFSIFFIGISILAIKNYKYGLTLTLLPIISWLIYAFADFKSGAEGEIFGIIVIQISVIIYLANLRHYKFNRR
ncbi:DUF998 domain-containing protein [Caldisphaera sp.]|uniref:DUF998 domain-containing protein n=1 Tax=Caldisphaera sp. TaxID=2060322 RepID=UPI003D0CB732